MDFKLDLVDDSGRKSPLTMEKRLTGGKYEVFQMNSTLDNQSYALKLFPETSLGRFHYTNEILLIKLNHQNVIKHFPTSSSPTEQKYFILTEYAQHGDFFDLVLSGAFHDNDTLIRTYFHQLIEGLEHLHSNGVVHLDIKLENLMIGSDYMLKIIDFDQAQTTRERCMKSKGTQGYRPLEVLKGECSELPQVDVYAAGIILYALKAGEFPFIEKDDPQEKDIRCYLTYMKYKECFWLIKNELKQEMDFFDDSFIELVDGMIHENPKMRMSLEQIKNSEWYQGPILDKESLKDVMEKKLKSS